MISARNESASNRSGANFKSRALPPSCMLKTTVRSGETAVVPPGVKHTFRNNHDKPTKAIVRIRPAGRSEAFFRDMHRLIQEGNAKRLPPNEPSTAIYAAMLYDRYPDFIRATGILNGVFKVLALVGKTLRFDF